MPGLCRYSKKVADEYPFTQAVPDDPHSVPPKHSQNTNPKISYLRPPKEFLKLGNYAKNVCFECTIFSAAVFAFCKRSYFIAFNLNIIKSIGYNMSHVGRCN